MKTLVEGKAKGRKVDRDSSLKYEPKWIVAKRGLLILTEEKLIFENWDIPLSNVAKAVLSTINSVGRKGHVLTVTTTKAEIYQFGLLYDHAWEKQTVLPVQLKNEVPQYSSTSIVFRVIFGGIFLWLISRWISAVFPVIQRTRINSTILLIGLSFGGAVLVVNVMWKKVASQNNYGNLYGVLIGVVLYAVAGFVGTNFSGLIANKWLGGITGMIVAVIDTIFGAIISYKLDVRREKTPRQVLVTMIMSLLVNPILGLGMGLLGGSFVL